MKQSFSSFFPPLIFFFFLLIPQSAVGLSLPGNQAEEFPKGKVIEKVSCKADASLSYALYLPANYATHKKWAILYGFDPGARGFMPVQQFKGAAEKYGYIVVG